MAVHFYRSSPIKCTLCFHMIQTPPFTMVVRHLSPQDKQETADMEPVSDAHMMLIDRCLPRSCTQSQGQCLPITLGLQGIIAQLQRFLPDLRYTRSGCRILFLKGQHINELKIKIYHTDFKMVSERKENICARVKSQSTVQEIEWKMVELKAWLLMLPTRQAVCKTEI